MERQPAERPARQAWVRPTRWSILHGAGLSVLVRVAGVGLSYTASILLSRALGLQGFGEYVIGLTWALALALPAKAGFDISALRFSTIYFESSDFARLRGFLSVACATIVALSLLIDAVILLAGPALMPISPATRLWAAALILPLALLAFFSIVLRTARRIVRSQMYEQIVRPSLIIAGVGGFFFFRMPFSAASGMAITVGAATLALLALLMELRTVLRPAASHLPLRDQWRPWLAVSLPMLLLGVVQELMNQIDIILLGQLADARQAALFAASWRIASLVPFAMVGLTTVAGPMIALAYDRKDTDELHRVSALVARGGFAFAVVSAAILFGLGGLLLSLFGRDFVAGRKVLSMLLVGGVVNAFTGVVGYLTILTGRERQALIVFAGALALSLVLNVLLIPGFGAAGAAVASSSATAAWHLVLLVYVRRSLGIDASAIGLAPRHLPSLTRHIHR